MPIRRLRESQFSQPLTHTAIQTKKAAQFERQEDWSITQTNFDFLPQDISDFIKLPNAHLKAVFFFIA